MSTNVSGTITERLLKQWVTEFVNRALNHYYSAQRPSLYPAVLDVATNSIFAWQESYSIFLSQRAEDQAEGIWIDPRLEEYNVEEYTRVSCVIAEFTLQQLRAHLDEWLVGKGITQMITEELYKAWHPVGPKNVLGVNWMAEEKVIKPFFQKYSARWGIPVNFDLAKR